MKSSINGLKINTSGKMQILRSLLWSFIKTRTFRLTNTKCILRMKSAERERPRSLNAKDNWVRLLMSQRESDFSD